MAAPACADWQAPAGWRSIEFISDLHLAPVTPRSFAAWAHYLRASQADAICLLGDVFEVWVGDDAVDEPGSFEAQCAEVLRDAAGRRCVAFMAGNRDFLVGDALLARIGVRRLADPTRLSAFGGQLLLSHGDLLCTADTAYQAFRREVRSPAWQQAFLARPLDERRALARRMRDASRDVQQQLPPEAWSEVDSDTAAHWLADAATPTLLHGHTHRPGRHALACGERWVLSDWDFDGPGPARGDLLRWTADGLARHTIAPPP